MSTTRSSTAPSRSYDDILAQVNDLGAGLEAVQTEAVQVRGRVDALTSSSAEALAVLTTGAENAVERVAALETSTADSVAGLTDGAARSLEQHTAAAGTMETLAGQLTETREQLQLARVQLQKLSDAMAIRDSKSVDVLAEHAGQFTDLLAKVERNTAALGEVSLVPNPRSLVTFGHAMMQTFIELPAGAADAVFDMAQFDFVTAIWS